MTQSLPMERTVGGVALVASLGDNVHAIPIEWVEEVLPALPIEDIPQCPDYVLGVVFVRGHLIPVLSAAERLGLKNYVRPLEPHIVCLRIDERLVGVEFDEALDLIDLDAGKPLANDNLVGNGGFFCGVIELDGKIVRLLNPNKLIPSGAFADLATTEQ